MTAISNFSFWSLCAHHNLCFKKHTVTHTFFYQESALKLDDPPQLKDSSYGPDCTNVSKNVRDWGRARKVEKDKQTFSHESVRRSLSNVIQL